jgi:hypothetical protein
MGVVGMGVWNVLNGYALSSKGITMPYITKDRREFFSIELEALATAMQDGCTPGDLNYLFTRLALSYVEASGGLKYAYINDVLGAFEGAKLELYRRLAAPYEDTKIEENGDVYGA